MTKKLLSKSSVNLYLQCPLKWKYVYIDGITSISSPAQQRGINIHKKIEDVYKKIKLVKKDKQIIPEIQIEPDAELNNFMKFENKRIQSCVDKEGKFDLIYFKPLFQELKMKNETIGLKGICDAVYINPDDNGIIIVDWKTGKFHGEKLDDYRFELAVYAELVRLCKKINVKYWAIYFTDQDKLFFEKIEQKYIEKMYSIVDSARRDMDRGMFDPKRNRYCYNCQFKNKCILTANV